MNDSLLAMSRDVACSVLAPVAVSQAQRGCCDGASQSALSTYPLSSDHGIHKFLRVGHIPALSGDARPLSGRHGRDAWSASWMNRCRALQATATTLALS